VDGDHFWLRLFGLVFLIGIAALLVWLLISAAWLRWGAFGALLFFGGILIVFGYIYDRRQAKRYEDLPE
jgi:hypothetical protein